MEIVVLTVVIVTLFLVFIVTIWRELNRVSSPNYKPKKGRPTGGRYALFNLIEDSSKSKVEKNKKVKRQSPMQFGTIADMESDGVYFNRENGQVISKEYVKKFKKRMKNK
jgi:hypothetical protein